MMRTALVLALFTAAVGCQQAGPPPIVETQGPDNLAPVEQTPEAALPVLVDDDLPTLVPPVTASSSCAADPEGAVSASELRWVKCSVEVLNAFEAAEVAMEFIAPGGFAYERRSANVGGSPERQVVEFELAVAGTMIDLNRMHGHWSANVFVDGEVAASSSFEVTP